MPLASTIPERDELLWRPSASFMEVAIGLIDAKTVFSLPGANQEQYILKKVQY